MTERPRPSASAAWGTVSRSLTGAVAGCRVTMSPTSLSFRRCSLLRSEELPWRCHAIHLGEMIREPLVEPALLLSLALQIVEMLHEEIADRVGWFEFQGQDATGREDAQEHLHPVPHLPHARFALTHPPLHPCWHVAVSSEVLCAPRFSPRSLSPGSFSDPTRDRGECRGSGRGVLHLEGGDDAEEHPAKQTAFAFEAHPAHEFMLVLVEWLAVGERRERVAQLCPRRVHGPA